MTTNDSSDAAGRVIAGSIVVVTGGTGSIGSAIVEEVLRREPSQVRVFSNDENGMHAMAQRFGARHGIRFIIGDVRHRRRLEVAFRGAHTVFHAAALKQVSMCEHNPFEALATNAVGTQNVVDAAVDSGVERVVGVSTDKAVNPTNVMGATKLLAERLLVTANFVPSQDHTVFTCARFGNVLGSRGSVLETVRSQVFAGGPVTLTAGAMTRYVTTIRNAARLVIGAARNPTPGVIIVPKRPSVRIGKLVDVAIEHFARQAGRDAQTIRIREIGFRAGERLHEALLTREELEHARVRRDRIEVLPVPEALPNVDQGSKTGVPEQHWRPLLSSAAAPLLSRKQIANLLRQLYPPNEGGLRVEAPP